MVPGNLNTVRIRFNARGAYFFFFFGGGGEGHMGGHLFGTERLFLCLERDPSKLQSISGKSLETLYFSLSGCIGDRIPLSAPRQC